VISLALEENSDALSWGMFNGLAFGWSVFLWGGVENMRAECWHLRE